MIPFDVQWKLTELNKRVFDLENQFARVLPAETAFIPWEPPPWLPWEPPVEPPHALGGPRHIGVGSGLERDGTDLRVDEDAAFSWTALHEFAVGISFVGATGVNVVTVPDNAAQAMHIVDAGAIEYLRIISTDAQPAVVFNEGGADVDHRWEASGQPNALFVQGSDGRRGMGTDAPAGELHIVATAVTNAHRPAYGTPTLVLDDGSENAVTLQLAARDYSTRMCHIVLTGAPLAGNNKHWIISHLGPDESNRFSIGYLSSGATGFSNWADVGEHFIILPGGNVGIGPPDPDTTLHLKKATPGFIIECTDHEAFAIFQGSDRTSFWIDTAAVGLEFALSTTANIKTMNWGARTPVMMIHGSGGLAIGDTFYATDPGTDNLIIEGAVGIGTAAPGGKCEIDQSVDDAAIPVLVLDQADIDQPFIEFQGGHIYADKAELNEFLRIKDPNGALRYIRLHADP